MQHIVSFFSIQILETNNGPWNVVIQLEIRKPILLFRPDHFGDYYA